MDMDLSEYISDKARRVALLEKLAGVSDAYLWQMANGKRPIAPGRCVEIEVATDRVVTRQSLRPDDWFRIWPELPGAAKRLQADRKAAAKAEAA